MTIVLDDAPLSIADLVRVARDAVPVQVAESVRERLGAARRVVDALAQLDQPIYGLNTALGANTGQPLAADDLADYQRRAVRARAVGVGPAYDRASVRAMLFARAASLRVGGSGASPAVLDALVALLNRGVYPLVPRWGSISVADLPQLSHLALPLMGEGQAEVDGEVMSGAQALQRAGLQPLALAAKDGLALVSANAATIGRAALVLDELHTLLSQWLSVVALSYEGFRANLSPLDPRAIDARLAPGQANVARALRERLDGSALWRPGAPRRVQDPISLRCVAQVHGAAHWMLDAGVAQVECELNSAADSPLVVDGAMLSNGNFHVPALALAMDALAIALAQVTLTAVERAIKFMSPAFTDLPLQLTRHGPAQSGFATSQKTLTALANEVRLRANPASVDFLPVSERVEDHATMALAGIEKLAEAIERARYVAAIEWVIAAQAVDLRGLVIDGVGRGAQAMQRALRAHVAVLDDDRPLGPDFERACTLLREGVGS
ncbi:MAG TPA: aromatic amino acid ammonia-lyase [Burkholderiaceae bacterium]|nr:aromatic amino acid ammonia-lyase [Burkholderiaceae bacterium]